MNKIDYQALREAAEKAGEDKWQAKKINGDFFVIRHGSYTRQHGYTSYQPIAEIDCKPVRDFVAKANPATVLALLDERERNQQYIKRRDQENEDIALTVGKLRVELEAEKQRAKDLFMENARLKSGIAGLIHLGIRYADVEVMRIAGDAQLSTPCTDSIINSIATGIRIKGE
ncbi:ead/Ea22-like family protein [Escherichia coli]|uniref:ead/Ea22-like family protein n=1 Tax=Escherichia coli TaxID=562 RepID=UPI0004DA2E80|nr:ead/Ea22-like family protein [Escherichia coli]EEC8844614.1 ead/Ea22-like family protein [Escherichia coli]EED0581355.1 ead/Ea22-like family protein [Escherichia coli]EED0718259.1 ead/Ea22-like family protein [Escherichia coli]EED1764947.1 ead/Ea22-like family protein [Escherichia coli]EEQ7249029.1 ead/Ea22-like family protein [Escherichia coli]